MKLTRRGFGRVSIAAGLMSALGSTSVLAQNSQDNGLVRFIVPYSPGTGSDAIARSVGIMLGERLGRPVVVENRVGASTRIGTEAVVRAAPNGSTLLITTNTMVINRALYPKSNFDPIKDLTPITISGWTQMVLVANERAGIKSVDDLLRAARKAPGKINYGSPGIGTLHHLAMELLKIKTDVDLLHVPFNGSGPAVTGLLAGEISVMFLPLTFAVAQIKSGRIIPLAIGSEKRDAALPEVPTLRELGIPDMNVPAWYGIYGPAGMPPGLVDKLNAELRQILQSDETRKRLSHAGVEAADSTAEELRQLTIRDADRWALVVKAQGIQAE